MKYDLLIANNASKKTYVYRGLESITHNGIYLTFHVDLSDLEDGEYTTALLKTNREDIEYDLLPNLLESNVSLGGKTYKLKEFEPYMDLMKIGDINNGTISTESKKEYLYL